LSVVYSNFGMNMFQPSLSRLSSIFFANLN
jgi:hypothetical protein